MLYFSTIIMIPLILVGYLISKEANEQIMQSTLLLSSQIVDNNAEEINSIINNIQKMNLSISSDPTLQGLIDNENQQSNLGEQISRRLIELSQFHNDVYSTYAILDNGIIGKTSYYPLRQTIQINQSILHSIENHGEFQYFTNSNGSPIVDYNGDGVILIGTSLINRKTGIPCGILLYEIRKTILDSHIYANFGANNLSFLSKSDGSLITASGDEGPEIMNAYTDLIKSRAIGENLETIQYKDTFLLVKKLSNGWILTSVVSSNFLREDSKIIFTIYLITLVIFMIINLFLAKAISSYELLPIKKINNYVDFVKKGDFSQKLEPMRPDEIGELSINIFNMAVNINELFQKIKDEQSLLRYSEYKILQAQINPHFLYNSLDSINWLARKGDIDSTTKMISSLSSFFRIGLSNGENIIPLKEEIQHVKSYLTIEKIRFQSLFNYYIYCSQEVENSYVPKLILQPIVENSLNHGIRLANHSCMIMINITKVDNAISIEIDDNGVGMNDNTLKQIKEELSHPQTTTKMGGFGLININNRIHLLVGDNYKMTISSMVDSGTSVRIVLPNNIVRK